MAVFKFDASTKQYLSAVPPPADPRRVAMVDGGTKRRELSSSKHNHKRSSGTMRSVAAQATESSGVGSPSGLREDSLNASNGDQVAYGAYEKR